MTKPSTGYIFDLIRLYRELAQFYEAVDTYTHGNEVGEALEALNARIIAETKYLAQHEIEALTIPKANHDPNPKPDIDAVIRRIEGKDR